MMSQRQVPNNKGSPKSSSRPATPSAKEKKAQDGDFPVAKKRKLSESPADDDDGAVHKLSNAGFHTRQYAYSLVTQMVVGNAPEQETEGAPSNGSHTPPIVDLEALEDAPNTESGEEERKDLPILTAEPVIRFDRAKMMRLAQFAQPYRPSATPGASRSSLPPPPWAKRTYASGMTGLDEELWDFYEYLRPSKEERLLRLDLFARLRKVIQRKYPEAEVRYFGSFATDMLLPTSDIDVVVLGIDFHQGSLYGIRSALVSSDMCVGQPTVVSGAKVPLVKFTDATTGFEVDISFTHEGGLRNTDIINAFARRYRVYRPLLLALKFFLHQASLNEPYNGGVGSYALSLMVASFLQLHPLTQNDTGFTDPNLGHLLVDFLALYGKNFNYCITGISVRGHGSYFNKFDRNWVDINNPSVPAIEDPNDITNDVGRSAFRMLDVRKLFKDWHSRLVNVPADLSSSGTILSRIVRPDHYIDHARTHLPELLGQLLKVASFRENVQPLMPLFDANDKLLDGADVANLGLEVIRDRKQEVEKLLFGEGLRFSPLGKPAKHNPLEYIRGVNFNDSDVSNDSEEAIVISDEEDSQGDKFYSQADVDENSADETDSDLASDADIYSMDEEEDLDAILKAAKKKRKRDQ